MRTSLSAPALDSATSALREYLARSAYPLAWDDLEVFPTRIIGGWVFCVDGRGAPSNPSTMLAGNDPIAVVGPGAIPVRLCGLGDVQSRVRRFYFGPFLLVFVLSTLRALLLWRRG